MSFFVIYGALSALVLAGAFFISYGFLRGNRRGMQDKGDGLPTHTKDEENEEILDLAITDADLTVQDRKTGRIPRVISHALKAPRTWKVPLRWNAFMGSGIHHAIKRWIGQVLAFLEGRRRKIGSPPTVPGKEFLGDSGKAGAICGRTYWPPRPLLSFKSFSSRSKEKVRVKY